MEKSIKGTRTEQNLLKAFAGESQARSRYVFFASKAKKEGYEQIAGVFAETAEQEKEHAERFFKFLEGGDVEITASYPTGPIGTTAENLLAAAHGEKEEWDVLYREFAKVAEEEGFIEIATAFKMISTVEAEHERRYLKLLSRLTDGNFFKRDGKIWWQCRNCGFVIEAEEAPKLCPPASIRRPTSSRRKRTIDGVRKLAALYRNGAGPPFFAAQGVCAEAVGFLSLHRDSAWTLPDGFAVQRPACLHICPIAVFSGRKPLRICRSPNCRFLSEDCGIFIIFAG